MGIGPSTKETSLHHFRDPLLEVVAEDTDLDLMGVMLVGSPDGNEDKMLVGTSCRVGRVYAGGRRDPLLRRMGKQPCGLYEYD